MIVEATITWVPLRFCLSSYGNDIKLIRCCPGLDGQTAAMLVLSGMWMRLCQVESPLQERVWLAC